MRAEFDGAAFYCWLMKEAEEMDWGGAAAEPGGWSLEVEEESADEARARVNQEERERDEEYQVYLDDANLEAAE